MENKNSKNCTKQRHGLVEMMRVKEKPASGEEEQPRKNCKEEIKIKNEKL